MKASLTFITLQLFFLSLACSAQPGEPSEAENLIEHVLALHTRRDTVRLNEIVEIRLNTTQDIGSFKSLYLDGIKVENVKPWKSSEVSKSVFFTFDKNVFGVAEDFVEGEPASTTYVPVYISVSNDKGTVATSPDPLYMAVKYKNRYGLFWAIILAGTSLILIIFSLWQKILKDDRNAYYSLGRTQLFLWTVIFAICYFFIWLDTGSLPDITTSTLVILGISAGTTAAAKVIERGQNPEGAAAAPDAQPDPPSRGLLFDILTDYNGRSLSVHRFQNVLFTVVFGVIFLQKVFYSSVLPDFDDNALILMGISSGTYAGLKITEKEKQNENAA